MPAHAGLIREGGRPVMKLALSGFLFEDNYASQSLDLRSFFSLARAIGYEGVELRDTQIRPDSPPSLKEEVQRLVHAEGLPVTCLTARYLPASGPERDAFFVRYLDLCQDLGCRLLKISSDAVWLREAAARAEACGVTLTTNNHIGSRLETIAGTRDYFREIHHPAFRLLYDALHLSLGGEDYVGFIQECFPLTCNILVHSLRPPVPGETPTLDYSGKKWTRVLPDDPGAQPDWPAVLSRFKALGYQGWITVIENGWPVERREPVARHCAAAIRRIWQQTGP
jgi:sugar phosphate isomerase/epimerase